MSLKFKSFAALALSAAMMFSVAACGTTDSGDAKSDSKAKNTTVGYDVSTIKKDDELAKLAASAKTVKDGELSVGMELSYAPAEFYAEDGKTPVGYDVDMSKAIAQTLGLKPKIVSSMFDTIVPSIGSKYDLGITAMTITEERLQSVDFVSYYRAGSTWAVDPGQTEAAKALGMKRTLIMRRIVLPQAMRIIIPPTGNEFIGMLKTTSLVNAVPFTLELQFATTAIATRLYKPIPLLIVACIWYLVITSILMVIQSRLEKHFGKGFDARPAGARGKRTPLPGKTFGEPKDDIDKQNEATFAGMTA